MNYTKEIQQMIENKKAKIGIIGLGYVGLPLLWTFHKANFHVYGFDVDEVKIRSFKNGTPYIKHLGSDIMKVLSESSLSDATTDFKELKKVDVIIICVPTPLNKYNEPDMSFILSTTKTIAKNLRKNQLIILESTTWPGTTEELMIPILEKDSSLKVNEDFFVAYSPEREDPGNKQFNTQKIPKVVGGHGKEALKLSSSLYSKAIDEIIEVSSCRVAEATKLTENIFRSVNIAMVNELKTVFAAMNINVHEVLEAASSKPFGFMKFTPGPGLGGHCIPIDPFYLSWKAKEFGKTTRFIELAGEINTNMPNYVIQVVSDALNHHKKSINGSKILIIGMSYKPDIDDIRESPSLKLFELLNQKGASVDFFDTHIEEIGEIREYASLKGLKSIKWKQNIISGYDAILISTNHSDVNYGELLEWNKCIIDTRNSFNKQLIKFPQQIFNA